MFTKHPVQLKTVTTCFSKYVLFNKGYLNINKRAGVCESNRRPGGKYWQPTVGFMIHVTCRLTAKNRDQLRNITLGNRVGLWATFYTEK